MIFAVVLMSMVAGFTCALGAFLAGHSIWIMLACYSGGGMLTMLLIITLRLTMTGRGSPAPAKRLGGRLSTSKA